MKIQNHRLVQDDGTPYRYVESPNTNKKKIIPEYLVIHYTAGRNLEGAVSWLTNPQSKASAHIVIGRDGKVAQLVPFDTIAWHAGLSQWEGRVDLNKYSIGIELDNAGKLKRNSNNKWWAWFGRTYPNKDVIEAVHKHDDDSFGWHTFTPVQIEVATEVAALLMDSYPFKDIVGHDDISPRRKWDPGPAFPMENFKAKIVGRADEQPQLFLTTIPLAIRTGPGSEHPKILTENLPEGSKVFILEHKLSWAHVDVVDDIDGEMDIQGWVHARYLKREDIE